MASNRYCIDLAKRGTAGCKECKQKIDKGVCRIAKIIPSPFSEGDMKQWFHVRCIFTKLSRARATTKKIDATDDLEGWDDIDDEYQEEVVKCIQEFSTTGTSKSTPTKKAKKDTNTPSSTPAKKLPGKPTGSSSKESAPSTSGSKPKSSGKDNLFREFRRILANVANEPSHLGKTAIFEKFFDKGADGKGFKGDLLLWVKMLLPGVTKTVYNLQSKQLVKLFSQIFEASHEEMIEDLEQGDIAETVCVFFEESTECPPSKHSDLTMQEVASYLQDLSAMSKEEEQTRFLRKIAKRCTGNDLKTIVRLIMHDLRIGAGAKPVLTAIHPTAYAAFQASRNLEDVIKRSLKDKDQGNPNTELHVKTSLMTPVLPMLAQACASVEAAFAKCPNGVLAEIKYDGERVQLHKQGLEFNYFSRSLKPVMPHKILHFKEFIPKAFPSGNSMILDCEILLVDNDGKPLPFGTLGAHRKKAFTDATVCLFVFDCLQFNDENLMHKPLIERRKILEDNMKPIKNRVILSELKEVKDRQDLQRMINSIIRQGLEGLVIKDKKSIYEPGKRHWLKMKKDYLKEGAMADSADLVVLGAYYGTGKKGGIMSVFLMGCFNTVTGRWCTVTKVTGFKDNELAKLQKKLKMIKISKDPLKVPPWLNVEKSLIPDFVSTDPETSPVWEIAGAEFSKSDSHTAAGLSIRFPRVLRVRDDKTPKEATTLKELQSLYEVSKQTTEMIGLASPKRKREQSDSDSDRSPKKKKSSPAEKENSKAKRSRSHSRSRTPSKKDDRRQRSKSPNSSRSKKREKDPTASSSKHSEKRTDKSDHSTKVFPKLLEIFSGVKLCLPTSVKDLESLKRYFIAYDGVLLQEYEAMDASHVIIGDSQSVQKSPKSALQININWLWDCIKLRKILPTRLYKPGAIPCSTVT